MPIAISRLGERLLIVAAQWTGQAGDLSEVRKVGFDLQPEEGHRTGQKPLIVHNPDYVGYNPLRIQIGSWAVRDVSDDKLRIMTNEEMVALLSSLCNEAVTIRSQT